MDLIYMSDVMAYQSIRGPIYERYEYQYPTNKQGKNEKGIVEDHHSGEGKCKICKEKQRRALASYIRSKSIDSSTKNNQIIEEEEESCHQAQQ